MAGLQVNFNVIQANNSLSVRFTELTGAYNLLTNPTGYGFPNATLAQVSTATIFITRPDGVQFTLQNISPLPSSTNQFIDITNVDLGLNSGTKLQDGFYVFTYEAQGTTPTQSGILSRLSKNVLLYNDVECCVRKMGSSSCGCTHNEFVEAFNLFNAMLSANLCGNYSGAQEILERLQVMCSNKCKCH
jgi:hypothetical protein